MPTHNRHQNLHNLTRMTDKNENDTTIISFGAGHFYHTVLGNFPTSQFLMPHQCFSLDVQQYMHHLYSHTVAGPELFEGGGSIVSAPSYSYTLSHMHTINYIRCILEKATY